MNLILKCNLIKMLIFYEIHILWSLILVSKWTVINFVDHQVLEDEILDFIQRVQIDSQWHVFASHPKLTPDIVDSQLNVTAQFQLLLFEIAQSIININTYTLNKLLIFLLRLIHIPSKLSKISLIFQLQIFHQSSLILFE